MCLQCGDCTKQHPYTADDVVGADGFRSKPLHNLPDGSQERSQGNHKT